jgi:hypothetical protein
LIHSSIVQIQIAMLLLYPIALHEYWARRTRRMNPVPKTDRVLLVSNIKPIGLLCSSERFLPNTLKTENQKMVHIVISLA